MNDKGMLIVSAETPIESFALKMWQDNFSAQRLDPSSISNKFAVLAIYYDIKEDKANDNASRA